MSAWAFGGATPGRGRATCSTRTTATTSRDSTRSTPGGKTFDAVKADVRARLAVDRAVERAVPQANDLATAARGSALEAAAEARKLTVQKTRDVDAQRRRVRARQHRRGDRRRVRASGQHGERPDPRRSTACSSCASTRKKPADKVAFEAQKKQIRAQRLQQLKQQRLQAYYADLRKSAKIDDRRKEITARARRQSVT